MKSRIILLPYFQPPKEPIKIKDVIIDAISVQGLTDKFNNLITFSEVAQLLKKRYNKDHTFENSMWTILIVSNNEIPDVCYSAIFDILQNNWKYILKRNDFYNSIDNKEMKLEVPNYKFCSTFLEHLENGINLITENKHSNKRFCIALQRWVSSYTRQETIDSVLDCCASLEALFNYSNELRLRISCSVYHFRRKDKKKSFEIVYNLYGIRSNFIHGVKIPEVSKKTRYEFLEILANIFNQIIKDSKLPDIELLNEQIIKYYTQ